MRLRDRWASLAILTVAVAALPAPGQTLAGTGTRSAKPMSQVVGEPATNAPAASCAKTVKSCNETIYCFPGTNSACRQVSFVDGLEWRICIYTTQYGKSAVKGPSKGLAIGPVDLHVPHSAWRRVIYTATTAEIFTGYDFLPSQPGKTRLYDTQYSGWEKTQTGAVSYNWSTNKLTTAHLPANGWLITLSQDAAFGPRVAAECRDRGIAWLCHGIDHKATGEVPITKVRRGEEFVLWGVFDAGNYDYVVEYGFRDDGAIAFRTGATGYNNTGFGLDGLNLECKAATNKQCGDVSHIHDVLWRVDIDINGGAHDEALQVKHVDPLVKPPQDNEQPFNGGFEGGVDWNPAEFTSLLIEDTAHINSYEHHPGYEVHPLRFGNARQAEKWAVHDFWVTRWHPTENTAWADTWASPDTYLSAYTTKPESIADTDVVLWYLATAHHDPVDEDRQKDGFFGVTLIHYFGFDLTPHNVFPANPLGAPNRCDVYH